MEFEWEAPVGAIAYNIAIINDTTGELLYFVTEAEDLLLETSFTFEGLPDNGDTILWTVFAASDVEWSDFAFPRTFVNGTAPDETFSEYEMSITGPEELLVGQAGEYDVRA